MHQKAVQKIIAMLSANSDVTQYVPALQIYGGHISTIQDAKFPAISLHIGAGPGKSTTEGGLMRLHIQVDLWFQAVGAQSFVWDDVFTCYQAVVDTLHRNGGYDEALGARITQMTNVMEGPQMFENETGLMHWPSRFLVGISEQ